MRNFLAATFITLMALPAHAQDISTKLNKITPGSYVVYKVGQKTATHAFAGKFGRYYLVEVCEGAGTGGKLIRRDHRSASGEQVKKVFADGKVISFKPHNCQRVVGECRYTEIGPNYQTKMLRINTPTKSGLSFKQYALSEGGEMILIYEGSTTLDPMGNVKSGVEKWKQGKHTKIVQKKAVYK